MMGESPVFASRMGGERYTFRTLNKMTEVGVNSVSKVEVP